MKTDLRRLVVKLVCLVGLLSASMVFGGQSGQACQSCVYVVNTEGNFAGCAMYGSLGFTWCVPMGSHCHTSGMGCNPNLSGPPKPPRVPIIE